MPIVIGPSVVKTHPVSSCVLPSLTNVKAPELKSAFASDSVALIGAPEALTV